MRHPTTFSLAGVTTAAAVMVAVALTPQAQAAFPGRNGALLVRGTTAAGCAQPTVGTRSSLRRCALGPDRVIRQESLFLADPSKGTVRLFVQGRLAENTFFPSGRFAPNGRVVAVGGGDFSNLGLDGLLLFSSEPGLSPSQLATDGILPSWSPDGRTLAYDGPRGITTLAIGSGKPPRLIRSLDAVNPIWSTRNLIAFSDDPDRSACPGLCLMQPDGRGVRPARFGGTSPDWSPNGHRLVVVSGDQRTEQISIGCINGAGTRHLTIRVPRGSLEGPVWSPNREKIAFTYKGNVYEIPTKPPRPLRPRSWRKVVANATLSDWQPLPGGLPAPPAVVCH